MSLSLQKQEIVKVLKQFYGNDKISIFKPIRLNSTTRIAELVGPYQKRIISHKNKNMESRLYRPKTNGDHKYKNQNTYCPIRYTKVICHACYQEIMLHDLYLSKNGEHGRSKYYHINCATLKNIL